MTDNTTGTAIEQWDPNSGAALPAYLADALGELGTNIPDRQSVPSLSYEGKTWQIVKDGSKTMLQSQNADGDMVPIPIMRVVVLACNPDRGRAYYEGTYNPAASTAPKCWSADGKAPDPSVREKVSPACTGCPMSIKGSKIQDGREMVACSSHRMLVIAPPDFDPTIGALRLKIAVTSDYDKETVEHGWFAFRQYMDFLKMRGIGHSALVVTKIKFDATAAYPKLLFALDRILAQHEIVQMKVALADPKVAELLAEKWTAAGSAGTPTNDSDIAPQPDLQTTTPVLSAVRPKPTDPSHIAHAGTGHEVWWDEKAWVKPWIAVEVAPEPVAPPPPPAPAPAPVVQHDPHAAALADGWLQHPESPPHGYKGTEVLDWPAIEAKYPGNAASAPAAPVTEPQAAATATTDASPSDATVPPDVQNLLAKWGA